MTRHYYLMRVLCRHVAAWAALGWVEQVWVPILSLPGQHDVLMEWSGEGEPPIPTVAE